MVEPVFMTFWIQSGLVKGNLLQYFCIKLKFLFSQVRMIKFKSNATVIETIFPIGKNLRQSVFTSCSWEKPVKSFATDGYR